MTADLKMFRIPLTTTPPSVTMVYAVSKTQAKARFWEHFCPDVCEATALQIQDAVEGKLTILGKPDPGDPRQEPLELRPNQGFDQPHHGHDSEYKP